MSTVLHEEPLGALLRLQHLISSFNSPEYDKLIKSFLSTLTRENTLSLIFNSLLQSKNKHLINTLHELVSSIVTERLNQKQLIYDNNQKPKLCISDNNTIIKLIDLPSNIIEFIASSLYLDDLISFEQTNRFIASCCRTSNASKYLTKFGFSDWFKNLVNLNQQFYNKYNNTLTHKNNLTSFTHRWHHLNSMQLKLGRKIRRGIDDTTEPAKQHSPWCNDEYLQFISNLVLKPLFKTVKHLCITMKDHSHLALFRDTKYEFPNVETLTLFPTYSHDLIQFMSSYHFPKLKHLKFTNIYHDRSAQFNATHQSITDSLLDNDKDFSQHIIKFIDVLIPNYSGINDYLDPENEINEILKIHSEYEQLSLSSCELESNIEAYDTLFMNSFLNAKVIKVALKNLNQLTFEAWEGDNICIALVTTILMQHSENLTALDITMPISPLTQRLDEVDLEFSNLKELSIKIRSIPTTNVYNYIVERCHNLKTFKIAIDDGLGQVPDNSLRLLSNFCVNNAATLENIEVGIYLHDNLSIHVVFSWLCIAITKLEKKKLKSCNLKLKLLSDTDMDADVYLLGIATVAAIMYVYCEECILIVQLSPNRDEKWDERLLKEVSDEYTLHWSDNSSLALKKSKL